MTLLNKFLFGVVGFSVLSFVVLLFLNSCLRADLARVRAESIICESANADFLSKIDAQNRAVENIKSENERRMSRIQIAAQEANEKARKYFVVSENLKKYKAVGDECKNAKDLVEEYIRLNKK